MIARYNIPSTGLKSSSDSKQGYAGHYEINTYLALNIPPTV
jgi:hypothetical protein